MNDPFGRSAGGLCIVVVAMLPAPVWAQKIVIPTAPAVSAGGGGPPQPLLWYHRHEPLAGLVVPFLKGLMPFAALGAAGFAGGTPPGGLAILNNGGVMFNPSLTGGAGNGNGNGNIGSNNGNGNLTNGNGNFGVGDNVGNGGVGRAGD
ncbi:hypothetical protein [Methylobacterium sp. NEAU K]|uniref:hypothetical protein n=1 Tax=Methylobacterium sp. NEAU K TaxID=3064946 RepID=UPI002733125A|nr:hypothetical protein [Methylobacterium sp. NEAU K]MDP4002162.1 hypothetical protein [Methylobacterium sp. NEAU K]